MFQNVANEPMQGINVKLPLVLWLLPCFSQCPGNSLYIWGRKIWRDKLREYLSQIFFFFSVTVDVIYVDVVDSNNASKKFLKSLIMEFLMKTVSGNAYEELFSVMSYYVHDWMTFQKMLPSLTDLHSKLLYHIFIGEALD